MSDIDQRLQALSDKKRALLGKMLKERQDTASTPSIAKSGHSDTSQIENNPVTSLEKKIDFSLFFFSDDGANDPAQKYRLLLESAKFADQHGFKAIWTPERHFHRFGGLYPNPSLLSAALAMITQHIQLRAGSVVLPLHNPLRVAEEWAVADNLSGGRVSVAFASGWFIDDFVFTNEPFEQRKEVMYRGITTIQDLWRGKKLSLERPDGTEVEIQLFPRPLQPELPIWISSSGSVDTFIKAGEIGAHLLTSLIGQTLEDLAQKIAAYRQALAQHGFDPQERKIALMLHTFIGRDLESVRETVRQPMYHYLRSNLELHTRLAKRRKSEIDLQSFTLEDELALLEHTFERYFQGSALFGTTTTSLQMLNKISAIGVDEVACLIDFGLDVETVLESLHQLALLQTLCPSRPSSGHADSQDITGQA